MTTVSLLHEIPEDLYKVLSEHLDQRPDMDQNRLMTVAIAHYLIQATGKREAARIYLDTLFGRKEP